MTNAALPTLRTPRLTLRPLTPDDTDAVFAGVANFDVLRWLGRIPYPYGREDAVAFIARARADDLLVWAIENSEGFIGIAGVDEELGYWLARPAWGNGYAFEAAVAVAQHWFSDPGRSHIASGHYNDNARSQRLLRALGFAPVGERLRFARALSQSVMGTDMMLTRQAWQVRSDFTVKTSRLVLRPWTAADASTLASLITEDVARMTGSMSAGWSAKQAAEYIAAREWRGWPGFMLAIEHSGKMIGAIGCGGAPMSLMYVLGSAYWRRGFASEAVAAFLDAIFERFTMGRVHADCFEDNPASANVLRKAGFEETGRKLGTSKARLEPTPVITYALTREKLMGLT